MSERNSHLDDFRLARSQVQEMNQEGRKRADRSTLAHREETPALLKEGAP